MAAAVASGLLTIDDLQAASAHVRRIGIPSWSDGDLEAICSHLIDTGRLTCLQCAKLCRGRYKGFFVDGRYELLDRLTPESPEDGYLAEDLQTGRRVTLRFDPEDVLPLMTEQEHDYRVEDLP
jgi:hypothetical protein